MLMSRSGDLTPAKKTDLKKGVAALERRGPDFQDKIYYKNIALAHTRLAILDLNARSQSALCKSGNGSSPLTEKFIII